jgi:hypothetical protein
VSSGGVVVGTSFGDEDEFEDVVEHELFGE